MSRYGIMLLLVLAAVPARAQSLEKPELALGPLYTNFAALGAADGYLTWKAVHNGGVERNPLVAPISRDPGGLAALKFATGAATILAVERIRKDHPRAATWIMVAANGGMMWVVWHNASVVRARR
jgi:hypothetical protein